MPKKETKKVDNTAVDNTTPIDKPVTVDLDSLTESEGDIKPDDNIEIDDFFKGMEVALEPSNFEGVVSEEDLTEGNTEEESEGGRESDSDNASESEELTRLRKQYDDSSKEAIRLRKELDKFEGKEEFMPLLDVMENDPNLIRIIRDYLKSGGASPNVSYKERLGLGEDFVFDMDEALSNPNSDSAKVFDAMVTDRAQSLVSANTQRAQKVDAKKDREKELETEKESLREKYPDLTDEFVDEMMDWAKNHKVTVEDVFLLYPKSQELVGEKIANKAIKDRIKQSQKMADKPRSLGSRGDESESISPEDALINAMEGMDGGKIF